MKSTLKLLVLLVLGNVGLAYAAGAEVSGFGPALIGFFAFLGLYVLGQLLPGLALFWALLKELFAPAGGRNTAAAAKPERHH